MSYWYEATAEDVSFSDDGKDMHIYLGTRPAYDDCGNIYVSIKVGDINSVMEKQKNENFKKD
jgi:hypothetical protein